SRSWRDDALANASIHPRQLYARLATAKQAVVIAANAVTCSSRVSGQDGLNRAEKCLARVLRKKMVGICVGGGEESVDGDDVPECGIDRVVFGSFAMIRESVRQHPVGDVGRPPEKNLASLC